MIKVVNKYREPNHIYIGRGSTLGNPFAMKDKSDQERFRVIKEYKDYFKQQLLDNSEFRMVIMQLIMNNRSGVDMNLGCFCAPKACHGDIIKNFVESIPFSMEVSHEEIIRFTNGWN